MTEKAFSEVLWEAMLSRGLSRTDLAFHAGIKSETSIHRWLKGTTVPESQFFSKILPLFPTHHKILINSWKKAKAQASINRIESIEAGDKFGRLVVIETNLYKARKDYSRKDRVAKVICDCGNELLVSYYALLRGNTQSCGCLKREKSAKRVYVMHKGAKVWRETQEIPWLVNVGEIFERLEVIEIGLRLKSIRAAKVRCVCKKEFVTTIYSLLRGNTRSCGCLKREKSSITMKKLQPQAEAWRETQRNFPWPVTITQKFGFLEVLEIGIYLERKTRNGLGDRAAKVSCTCGKEFLAKVDKLTAGTVTSCGCRGKAHRKNMNGVYKKGNRWKAEAVYQSKRYHIGHFSTSEEAAHARDDKMRELGAPESRMNFPRN